MRAWGGGGVGYYLSCRPPPGAPPPATLERFAFYEQAQRAFLILRSGEQRKYGNLILRKGVVSTD